MAAMMNLCQQHSPPAVKEQASRRFCHGKPQVRGRWQCLAPLACSMSAHLSLAVQQPAAAAVERRRHPLAPDTLEWASTSVCRTRTVAALHRQDSMLERQPEYIHVCSELLWHASHNRLRLVHYCTMLKIGFSAPAAQIVASDSHPIPPPKRTTGNRQLLSQILKPSEALLVT